MATLSPEFWVQLLVLVFTVIGSLATVAWVVSRALSKVNVHLARIEATVSPYGERLGALEVAQSELKDRVTKNETRYEEFDRLRREFDALRNRTS